MSTAEENTHWIGVWIVNDFDVYFDAQDAAREAHEKGDYTIMRDFVERVFLRGETDTVRLTAQEMSRSDMNSVDWREIACDLVDPTEED